MVKKTLLWAAYMVEPVSVLQDGIFVHIPTRDLPVSAELIAELDQWDSEYQDTLDHTYPPDSQFSTKEKERQHIRRGRILASRLQQELGEMYAVEYEPNERR